MSQFFKPTLNEMIAEVEREIALRLRVYPRRVADQKMTQDQSERQIEVMSAVSLSLRWLLKHEARIKELLGEKKE